MVCKFRLTFGVLFLILVHSLAADSATPLTGWTRLNSNNETVPGVLLSGSGTGFSSPAVGDLDGDPSTLEIAVAGADGRVYAYNVDGTLIWESSLPNLTCTATSKGNKVYGSVAIGDLDGDGDNEVVSTYGGLYLKKCDGGARAFNGQDGSTIWTFSTTAYSKKARFFALGYSVVGSPAVADTDGDGKMEIAFGSFDRNFYLLNSDGSVRWYNTVADTTWSSAALVDANSNGKLDVVFATDISQNKKIQPPTKNGGMVYAIKPDAVKGKRINFRDPRKKSMLWKLYGSKQIIQSSPSVGDVLASNTGEEVVISTGCFFPQNKKVKDGKEVIVISLATGRVLTRLPIQACNSNSAALADLNADGYAEIVAIENGNKTFGGSGKSKVTVWDLNQSSTPLWSVIPEVGGKSRSSVDFGEPVVADLDRNGSLEVIVANSAGVAVLNGIDGVQLTCPESSCFGGQLEIQTDAILKSVPAVADLNSDGVLELIVAGSAGGHGALYVWTDFDASIGSTPGAGSVGAIAWGMRGKNAGHTRR